MYSICCHYAAFSSGHTTLLELYLLIVCTSMLLDINVMELYGIVLYITHTTRL